MKLWRKKNIWENTLNISDAIKEEIESILYTDIWFIEIHTDDLIFTDKCDMLFDDIKKKYDVDDKFILNIIYNIIYNNEIDFCINLSTFSFHIGGTDRFFRLNSSIYYKLRNPINWRNIELKDINRDEAINKFRDIVLNKKARLIDGNWKDISEEEYNIVKLLCQIWFNKDLTKLLDLADMYSDEQSTYNNIILKYMIESKDTSVIDNLTCSDEVKKELKESNVEDYTKIYYDNFYEFLDDDSLPSFADNNPFYALYESLFEALKQAIDERNSLAIFKIQPKLKICSEQFEFALRCSRWSVEDKANLSWKYDIIVNFARWISSLGGYFKSQYYLPKDIRKQLFNYLDLIERKLFYPTIILLTSNLHTEKYSIYEDYLRYNKSEDFEFKTLTDSIEEDFNKEKTIEELIKRRTPYLIFTEGTINDAFEQKVHDEILDKVEDIDIKSSVLLKHPSNNHLEVDVDFIISDKKNTLTLIECKTQSISSVHKVCFKQLKRLSEVDLQPIEAKVGSDKKIIHEVIRSSKLDESILSQNNLKKFYFMKHFLDDINMVFLVHDYPKNKTEKEIIKNIASSIGIEYISFEEYKSKMLFN